MSLLLNLFELEFLFKDKVTPFLLAEHLLSQEYQGVRMKALVFLFSSFLAFTNVQAKDLSSVRVNEITYDGSGCPTGTVTPVFSPGINQFSLLYDAFVLDVGGSTQRNTETRSCEVKIRLSVPFGYTVNVDSADFRGFVNLDRGVVAHHTVDHQVGSNKLATYGFGQQIFVGPREESYFIQSQRPHIKLPKLLQCLPLKKEVTLSVRTRIKMTGGESNKVGLMTVDSADGKIEQRYQLSLKKCF